MLVALLSSLGIKSYVFGIDTIGETISFDVPSGTDIVRAEVKQYGFLEDFIIVVFVSAEDVWVFVGIFNYFLLLLCLLAF